MAAAALVEVDVMTEVDGSVVVLCIVSILMISWCHSLFAKNFHHNL